MQVTSKLKFAEKQLYRKQYAQNYVFSSPEQRSGRTIVVFPALALAAASASANVIFYVKVFRTSLFANPLMNLVYIWYDDRYWSKVLFIAVPIPIHDLKVKVTDVTV